MSSSPRRALIVIDVQNEYVTGDLPIEYPDVNVSLANIGRAIDAAARHHIPVVLIQNISPATSALFARGSVGAALHDVVTSRPHAAVIEKTLPSAFAGTGLADWLSAHEIDTIVIAGYMTHNCDDSTVKHAVHAGLAVEFLSDATGSVRLDTGDMELPIGQTLVVRGRIDQSRFGIGYLEVEVNHWNYANTPR